MKYVTFDDEIECLDVRRNPRCSRIIWTKVGADNVYYKCQNILVNDIESNGIEKINISRGIVRNGSDGGIDIAYEFENIV